MNESGFVKRALELQSLFDQFSEGGSWMSFTERDEPEPTNLGVQDSYKVTRVTADAFWLLFKVVGDHDDYHHTHTIKVTDWRQDDDFMLDLVDDAGHQFHIKLISPDLEPHLAEQWNDWRSYKAGRREWFKQADAQLYRRHVEIAATWQ
ncbi:MAG: hypothetical protein OXO50_09210 [Caldilineaceae bacterium]|nr:hypothetical protein [Caldilineaceae bacterium]